MKWSLVNVVRNTLLALAIGALLPSMASACSLTPGQITKGDSGGWIHVPDATASLMDSATLLGSIPFGNEQLDIFKISDGHFALAWFNPDAGDSSSSVGSATSTTPVVPGPSTNDDSTPTAPTPEPSSLALLGFGAIALGLAFASRRLRATPVG